MLTIIYNAYSSVAMATAHTYSNFTFVQHNFKEFVHITYICIMKMQYCYGTSTVILLKELKELNSNISPPRTVFVAPLKVLLTNISCRLEMGRLWHTCTPQAIA